MKLIIFAAFAGICAAGALPALPAFPALPKYVAPQYRYPQYSQYPQYYQDQRPRAALERNAAVLRSESEVNENGYRFAYDTENGISAEESGVEANGIQAQGGFSYTGDDGQVYSVRYTAGDNGFQPQGSHIPTPPPVPEAIARSLAENARDEAAGIFDDGSYRDDKYSSAVVAARAQYYPGRYYPGFKAGKYY